MFRFKQFAIRQHRSALKVGTDAVVFGAWVDYRGAGRILDIGTGTGVLALIAAQRSPQAAVHAVEIDDASALEAAENAAASPWAGRIRVHRMDARRLKADAPFDLILCNPPYHEGTSPAASARGRVARHGAELSFAELVAVAESLLGPAGRFAAIVPTGRQAEFIDLCAARGLHLARRCMLRYVARRPPKRALLELRRERVACVEEELTVEGEGPKSFSPEARALVADLIDR
ncbi:MAG: tRNA1(Val) (adenine(37)-N6)-methyltransferase [Flavobacteriales bacterium]